MSCCPTNSTAVTSNYKPKSVPEYDTGDYKSKIAVIYVPDIFGFTPQSKQVCDILAERTQFRVIALDYFNNAPWKKENFPPKPEDNLMQWIGNFDYETQIKPATQAVIEKLKYQGVEEFYAIGNCWGAKMTLQLQVEGIITKMVGFHPSFFSDNDTVIKAPQCLLLSKDEAPLLGIKAAIEQSEFASQSVFERFDNMPHGWMAARADFDDAENARETERGIDIAVKFLTQQ